MNRRDFGRTGMAALVGGFALPAAPRQAPREYRYVHLDVFTDTRLQGNQLLVFVQPAGLDADAMQSLTRESNYSECTFVQPPEVARTDHRVRIFTRTAETPFAGHPTIGTAFALAHTGALKAGIAKTVFGLGVGPTNVDLEWRDGALAVAWMTQLKPTFGKSVADSSALAAALGLDAGLVSTQHAAQEVNCGSNFFIVPLTTRKAVDAAIQDRARMDAVFAAAGIQRRGVYAFSTESGADGAAAYSRLVPAPGGSEDPGTGSAAGPAGCFMAQYGFVARDRVTSIDILQGVQVRRPSRIHVNVTITGDQVSGVKVGGSAVVVGEGTMAP